MQTTSTSKTNNRHIIQIIFSGLLSGVLLTALYWLRVPDQFLQSIFWLCMGSVALFGTLILRRRSTQSGWLLILAVFVAVSLVYLFPEMLRPDFGARPLKRTIQRELQDPLALKILSGEFHEGETIKVDRGKEGLTFTADVSVIEGEVVA